MTGIASSPEVSVIVPAYCVERYLDRCVQSIVNQTFSNFELILIDDGSTDSTGKLCDIWEKKDGRIKVIHTENKGLSAARNTGFQFACGDWVLFVDADDELERCALATLTSYRNNVDVVAFGWILIDEFGRKLRTCLPNAAKEGTERLLLKETIEGPLFDYAWSYFFRRETLCSAVLPNNSLRSHGPFDETVKLYEDAAFMQDFLRSNAIVTACISKPLYLHRRAQGSLSRRPNITNARSGLEVVGTLSRMNTPLELRDSWNTKLIMLLIGVFQLASGKNGAAVRREVRSKMKRFVSVTSFQKLTSGWKIKFLLWKVHLYFPMQKIYRVIVYAQDKLRFESKQKGLMQVH